jgi:hypothetical protein
MKYAVEMGTDAMIYIPKFHKDWFSHSKVDGGGYTKIQTGWRSHKPFFFF